MAFKEHDTRLVRLCPLPQWPLSDLSKPFPELLPGLLVPVTTSPSPPTNVIIPPNTPALTYPLLSPIIAPAIGGPASTPKPFIVTAIPNRAPNLDISDEVEATEAGGRDVNPPEKKP